MMANLDCSIGEATMITTADQAVADNVGYGALLSIARIQTALGNSQAARELRTVARDVAAMTGFVIPQRLRAGRKGRNDRG